MATALPIKFSESESEDDLERQESYDKKRSKLRGAALKAKLKKLRNVLEVDDECLIDTEDLKSNPSNVFIHDIKTRSNRAVSIKQRVHEDLLRLSRECGYSVMLSCTAPKPGGGRRGEPLKLSFDDRHGIPPRCSCRPYKVVTCSCSKSKQAVHRGVQAQCLCECQCQQVHDEAGLDQSFVTPTNVRKLASRAALGSDLVSPISRQALGSSQTHPNNSDSQSQSFMDSE